MMSMMPGVSVWYHIDRISRITSAGLSFDVLGKCIIDLSLGFLLKNTEPATGNQPGCVSDPGAALVVLDRIWKMSKGHSGCHW